MLRTELIAPIGALLSRHAGARPDKVAFRDRERAVTYGVLAQRTAALAGQLAVLGVAPSDRVAVWLPNGVTWIESCLATLRAGAVVVPISHDASEGEAVYRLTDAGCRLAITTAARASVLATQRAALPDLATEILVDGPAARYDALIAAPSPAPRDADALDDDAFILYTSGTTGRAKGVVLSLRAMLWVVAACWAPIVGLDEADVMLSPLPLFHSYALNLSVLGILAVGASAYIMERYSTSECLSLLREQKFTLFPGVPTMFHYLLEGAGEPAPRFPNLRRCVSAGAIMPATLNQAFEARFGVPLLDDYGITETATMVTMNWPVGTRVMGSCGLPVPGLAVRIVDAVSGADVAPGADGELIVRGPNLMRRYHAKPAETAAALRDGWYRTGDLARFDANGLITITGRLKELIIRGGQNIAPAEIEEVVNLYEPVLDCAVIGAPHDHLGEVPVLFVVMKPSQTLDQVALLAHCRQHLSAYKVPHAVIATPDIPRTGSGKIMRFKLRERLAQL